MWLPRRYWCTIGDASRGFRSALGSRYLSGVSGDTQMRCWSSMLQKTTHLRPSRIPARSGKWPILNGFCFNEIWEDGLKAVEII
jgi:hypothetical protein